MLRSLVDLLDVPSLLSDLCRQTDRNRASVSMYRRIVFALPTANFASKDRPGKNVGLLASLMTPLGGTLLVLGHVADHQKAVIARVAA